MGSCCDVDFPEAHFSSYGGSVPQAPTSWWGGIITGQQDGSGYQYKRNRYYDATTGRFTQEDPIGLAGGLNLYGYANGDPVNYSDPFGLCDRPGEPACHGIVENLKQFFANVAGGSNCALQGDCSQSVRGTWGDATGRFFGGLAFAARMMNTSMGAEMFDPQDPEVGNTLQRIESGQGKYRQDGSRFKNREGRLPAKDDPNYYTEWTVDTPGSSDRGARRIVAGKNGERYFTGDHYETFIDITPQQK